MTDTAARVAEFFDHVDSGDHTAAVAMFAPDCRYERPGYSPIVGTDGLAYFFREDRPIASGKHGLTAVVADGDMAAVHGEFHGVLRDGRPIDLRFADFFVDGPAGFVRRDTYFHSPPV